MSLVGFPLLPSKMYLINQLMTRIRNEGLIVKLLLPVVLWPLCFWLYLLDENNHSDCFWMKYCLFPNFSYVQKILNSQSVRLRLFQKIACC